jgi:transposase
MNGAGEQARRQYEHEVGEDAGEPEDGEAAVVRLIPMGTGYPAYVRHRVLLDPRSPDERAHAHGVSLRTVYRYDALYASTGSVERLPSRAGRHRSTSEDTDEFLRLLTLVAPSAYRDEMRQALLALTGERYSDSTISRRWKSMGFTLKRLRIHSRTRDESRRVRYWTNGPDGPPGVAGVHGIPVWLMADSDEAKVKLSECDRHYGHALIGERACEEGWVRARVTGFASHVAYLRALL